MSSSEAEPEKQLGTLEAIDRTINRISNSIAASKVAVDQLDKRTIVLQRLVFIRRSLTRQADSPTSAS